MALERWRNAAETRRKAIASGFRVPPEQQAPMRPEPPSVKVLRSNWLAYSIFLRNLTQFRLCEGVPTGLDYAKAFRQAEAAGIVGSEWDDWLSRMEILEFSYVSGVVERAATARGVVADGDN